MCLWDRRPSGKAMQIPLVARFAIQPPPGMDVGGIFLPSEDQAKLLELLPPQE